MRVTQSLLRNLQQQPERIATLCGERRRTWREFHERVARLAAALRSLGLAPGDVITTGTCIVPLPVRSGDSVEADFGALGRVAISL